MARLRARRSCHGRELVMTLDNIEAYLALLTVELRKRADSDLRFVEEARGHLTDAVERGMESGLDVEMAQEQAITQFGRAQSVAHAFVADRYRFFDRVVMLVAVVLGLAIASIHSSPFFLLIAAAMCGFIAPRQPWRWALAIGCWIAALGVVRTASPESPAMPIVLALPFVGAYAGMTLRRSVTLRLVWSAESRDGVHDFHDKKGFHFLVMTRRGRVHPELAAILEDPDTQLVPFLQRMTPAALGPLGMPESFREQSESSNPRVRIFQVVFGG